MTNEELLSMKETLSGYAGFQWVKSEKMGDVAEFHDVKMDEDGQLWIEFKDGSRINAALLDEFMIKMTDKSEALVFDVEEADKKATVGSATVKQKQQLVPQESPIHTLLKKQKPNPIDISIEVTLNVPPPELFGVLCGSFENAEGDIVDYVVSDIDADKIRESVREAIKKYYNQ